jgi:hypothetical protein
VHNTTGQRICVDEPLLSQHNSTLSSSPRASGRQWCLMFRDFGTDLRRLCSWQQRCTMQRLTRKGEAFVEPKANRTLPFLSLSPPCMARRSWARPRSRNASCEWSSVGEAWSSWGGWREATHIVHALTCSLPSGPPLAAGT